MKFIINILSDQYLNRANLASFVDNLKLQDTIAYQLVLKKTSLNGDLIDQITTKFPMVKMYNQYQEIDLDPKIRYYWLNLSVSDGLLPNAMVQWSTILNRHRTELLLLNTLNNNQNLQKQLASEMEKYSEVKVNTIKSVLALPTNLELDQIDLKDQLQMILGLQTYRLMDKPNRYTKTFDQLNLLGKNVLYHIHHHELEQWDGHFAKLMIDRLFNTPFLVRVTLPTLIISNDDWYQFAGEVVALFKNPPTILDADLKTTYQTFMIHKLALAIQKVRRLKNDDGNQSKADLKLIVKNLSKSAKRQLTLAVPITFIEQFSERS